MKAAVVEKPGVLTVRDIPKPEPGEYEALCKLLYGATCTGTDQHIIHDRCPWKNTYPTVLGHESVGRVVEVGSKVRFLKEGDLVIRVGAPPCPDLGLVVNWGGFAEFGIAKDHQAMKEDGLPESEWMGRRNTSVFPPDLDPAAATMMVTWRETFSYLTRMGVDEGATLLVLGSGGTGLSFVAHAKNLAASRIAEVGNAAREPTGRAVGATDYFDYTNEEMPQQVGEAFPDGFDFIIDSVGKAGQLDRVLALVKPGGTVGIYGIDDFHTNTIHPNRARNTFTFYGGQYDEAESHDRIISFIRDGSLDASLWIDLEHPFELDDINAAIDAVRERRMVKSLVRLSADD